MNESNAIELTKTSYNVFGIWGVFNLVLGFVALYIGYEKGAFISLLLATIGIVSGAIMITMSKGKFIIKTKINVPIKRTK